MEDSWQSHESYIEALLIDTCNLWTFSWNFERTRMLHVILYFVTLCHPQIIGVFDFIMEVSDLNLFPNWWQHLQSNRNEIHSVRCSIYLLNIFVWVYFLKAMYTVLKSLYGLHLYHPKVVYCNKGDSEK